MTKDIVGVFPFVYSAETNTALVNISPDVNLIYTHDHNDTGGVLIKKTATLRQVKTSNTDIAPTISYILTDHLNSTNVVTDTAGNIAELLDYYPYGTIRLDTGSFKEQRKYIGQEYDEATSLSYLNARYYNSQIGKFISEDPSFLSIGDEQLTKQNTGKSLQEYLMNPQAFNSYSYAENNPITRSDPNGKSATVASQLLGVGISFEGVGLGLDSTIFGAPAGLVIGGIGAVILGVGGLTYYFSKSDADSSKTKQDKPTIQPAPKPEDIRGKTSEEVGKMMKEKGWEQGKPTRNEGDRWNKPGTKGSDQIRIEKGNPKDPTSVKQGPYGRISENGNKSAPIPLKGNPTLNR